MRNFLIRHKILLVEYGKYAVNFMKRNLNKLGRKEFVTKLAIILIGMAIMIMGIKLGLIWNQLPELSVELKYPNNGLLVYSSPDEISRFPNVIGRINASEQVDADRTTWHILALLAREDFDYWDRALPISIKGILRAAYHNILAGKYVEGGSTITMMVARNLLGDYEKSLLRKINEILFSWKIEEVASRESILSFFLSSSLYGGTIGVNNASKTYFQVDDYRDLGPIQACELVAILRRPKMYRNKSWVLSERNKVLNILNSKYHFWSINKLEDLKASPVQIDSKSKSMEELYGWVIQSVRDSLYRIIGEDWFNKVGAVYTTISPKATIILDQSTNSTLKDVYEKLGLPPTSEVGIDDLRLNYPQAAGVIIGSGNEILGILGGAHSFYISPFSRVFKARRQPGSIFKVVLALTLFETDKYDLSSVVDASDFYLKVNSNNSLWTIPRQDFFFPDESRNTVVIKEMLAKSINAPAARLTNDILQPKDIAMMAEKLGFEGGIKPVPSISLGSNAVKIINVAMAMTVIRDYGYMSNHYLIREIKDKRGNTIYTHKSKKPKLVVSPKSAIYVQDALHAAVTEGSARRIKQFTNYDHIFFKTGTSNGNRDAWMAGSSSTTTIVVWIGMDNNSKMINSGTGYNVNGSTTGIIVGKILANYRAATPPSLKITETPSGWLIINKPVDRYSGRLSFSKNSISTIKILHKKNDSIHDWFENLQSKRRKYFNSLIPDQPDLENILSDDLIKQSIHFDFTDN